MSDIAFSMSLDNDRLRFSSPSCQEDYKKGSLSLATFTIIYCTVCVGLVLNNLIDISNKQTIDGDNNNNNTGLDRYSQMLPHLTSPEITVTKVMYIVLICQLVLLVFSSFTLLKGVFHKKDTLIMTWILLTMATILYAAVVIIRDFQLEGETAALYTKTILYVIFLLTETILMKHPIKAFRKVRQARLADHRRDSARYNSRNPEQAIITISGSMEPVNPDSLFKLPTYEEATSEDSRVQATDENQQQDKSPPSQPPEYVP